jgi:TRAP-type C4-dicarboxylate transport system permease small subunit
MERLLGALCMAGLVLITLANVLTRYFTDESLAWTEEFSIFLMIILTLAGAAVAAKKDGHLRIEAVYESKDPARRAKLKKFSAWVCAVFFCVLAVLFARFTYDEIRFGETSMGLGVPRWWYSVWITPLCLVLAWRCLQSLRLKVDHPAPDHD